MNNDTDLLRSSDDEFEVEYLRWILMLLLSPSLTVSRVLGDVFM